MALNLSAHTLAFSRTLPEPAQVWRCLGGGNERGNWTQLGEGVGGRRSCLKVIQHLWS